MELHLSKSQKKADRELWTRLEIYLRGNRTLNMIRQFDGLDDNSQDELTQLVRRNEDRVRGITDALMLPSYSLIHIDVPLSDPQTKKRKTYNSK